MHERRVPLLTLTLNLKRIVKSDWEPLNPFPFTIIFHFGFIPNGFLKTVNTSNRGHVNKAKFFYGRGGHTRGSFV